jgi:kynureninase
MTNASAAQLDAADPLAPWRARFLMPRRADGRDVVYLCGHSLGLQPTTTAQILREELENWASFGVEGHFDSQRPWLPYHEQLAPSLARLVGAQASEVVAMNSLTVNLHLMLATFYRPTSARHRILIEKRAFSSDRYAVASQIRWHGFDPNGSLIELAPRAGESCLHTDDICTAIEREGAQLATVMLPGVQYLTGQCFDMATIAACARRVGSTVGFDLAHAVGNVPLALHDWNADFAVWCSYKYLNSGPGSIAGAFVHERHAHADLPRLAGWWGHDKVTRFDMPEEFRALAGAEGWQISNPPIFAAAPLLASLRIFDEVGMGALRTKSLRLTGYLESLLKGRLADALTILTPATPEARGCQLSVRLHRTPAEARAVQRALAEHGMICDWREPDVIRIAPVPLYNTFADVEEFVDTLAASLQ